MKQANIDKIVKESSESFAKVIEEAYNKGYEDARLEFAKEVKIDDVTYIDLGLPSGTLWSFPLIDFSYGYYMAPFSYEKAMTMNIPTKEQWDELCEHCHFIDLRIIAPNGKSIGYAIAPNNNPSRRYTVFSPGESWDNYSGRFWLKAEPDSNHMVDVIEYKEGIHGITSHFTGFPLPCFLVRKL